MSKRILSLLLCAVMVLGMVACGAKAPAAEAPSADVAMQYITPEDAKGLLDDSGYVFFDIRKAADSGTSTIPGAQAWDMDKAKEGDAEAGKATMTEATKGLDKKIILVCYSGKRYAQAATNALSAIGYDMSKVYTLEGGFTAWSEKFPELAVAPEGAATAVPTERPVIHMAGAGLYLTSAEILQDMLKDKYDIQIITIDSNSGCVEGAIYGDVDCFLYNHEPWLMQYNASNGTNFKVMNHLYYGRSALYSDRYDSLDQLPDGATIAICNDSVNMENNLLFLERIGLIKLGEKSASDAFLTTLDVVENPKNIKFVEVEISYAVRSLEECDAIISPAPSVLNAGKDPGKFLAEDPDKVNYPIGLTILADRENEPWVADFVAALETDEFAERFNEVFQGAMVLY